MKGLIYKIICNVTNNIYIGSTTKKLNIRMSKHKYDCKTNKGCRSKEIIKNNDFKVETIEEIEFDNKIELHEREKFYIINNICVNKVIPNRTNKEYRENNKNKINEYAKEYRENNKNKIKENKKQYYFHNKDKIKKNKNEKFNCPCGGCYTYANKSQHNKTKLHIEYLENLK